MEALARVYPEIDEALANYATYARDIDNFEDEIRDYSQQRYDETREELIDIIDDATNDPWDDFSN